MLFIAVLFIITAAYVSYIVKPWKFSFLKNVIEQTLPYKKWGGKIAKCMYFMILILFRKNEQKNVFFYIYIYTPIAESRD